MPNLLAMPHPFLRDDWFTMTIASTAIDLDIRLFKRYDLHAPVALTIHGRHFKAKTTDFSPHGIGLIIDGNPMLKVGSELDIILQPLGINEKGRVAWKQELESGLRLGLLRIGPLKGNLGQYRISDVLIGLQRTLKTGILEVKNGTLIKQVFFRGGNPVYATSSQEKDRLGDILLKKRIISQQQYGRAAEEKRQTGERYAVILVNLGFVKPIDLFAVAKIQVQRIIGSLFLMRDGEFEFTEGPLPMEKVVPLNISLSRLIYRQVKKHADPEFVKKHLLKSMIDFSKTPLNLFQDVRLSGKERKLLSFVDGKTRIEDVVARSGVDPSDALKSIFALLEAKILEVRKKNESASGLKSEEVFTQARTSSAEVLSMIGKMQENYEKLGYYGVLELDLLESSDDKIKKAYYQAAKQYHPDRHFGLPEETKAKLTEIFTYITNAYIMLSDHKSKHEYDKLMKKKHGGGEISSVQEGFDNPYTVSHDRMAQNADVARRKFKKGLEKAWKGHFEEASHDFAAAIYFDSSIAEYHFHYGRCLVRMQKPKEAVSALNKALAADRHKPDALAEMGHAYAQLGFLLRAKGCFDKALGLDPSNKRAAEGVASLRKKKK